MKLNKDKETQTAQVENPTETEQAEQTATESTTEPTTPAEPDVQTSEEGGETPPRLSLKPAPSLLVSQSRSLPLRLPV